MGLRPVIRGPCLGTWEGEATYAQLFLSSDLGVLKVKREQRNVVLLLFNLSNLNSHC